MSEEELEKKVLEYLDPPGIFEWSGEVIQWLRDIWDTLQGIAEKTAGAVWRAIPDWMYSALFDIALISRRLVDEFNAFFADPPARLAQWTSPVIEAILDPFKSALEGLQRWFSDFLGFLRDELLQPIKGFFEAVEREWRGWMKLFELITPEDFQTFVRGLGGIGRSFLDLIRMAPEARKYVVHQVQRAIAGLFETPYVQETIEMIRLPFEAIAAFFFEVFLNIRDLLLPPATEEGGKAIDMSLRLVEILPSLAMPFALAIAAGELVHPLKHVGLPYISAIFFDLAGFSRLTQTLMETFAYSSMVLPLRYALYEIYMPLVPREEDLMRLCERGVLEEDDFKRMIRKAGYSPYWQQLYWDTHWEEVRYDDIEELIWRGIWDEGMARKWLRYSGYHPEVIDGFLERIWRIPDIRDLKSFFHRGLIDMAKFTHDLQAQGINPKDIDAFLAAVYDIPPEGDLREFLWKGLIGPEEYKRQIRARGISPEYAQRYFEALWKIPGPSDLIRFVVREVITPPEFEEWMSKQGFTPDWAWRFWDAHWILPPPERVWDAFCRGIIAEAEYRRFLMWHDYMPTPRPGIGVSDVDIMLGTQYSLPGRIDYRWMWEWGAIDDAGLRRGLELEGLHPEWRERILQGWRGMLLREETMGVVRELERDYVDGWISEAELREALAQLGIPATRREFYIRRALLRRTREAREGIVKALDEGFELGWLDEPTYRAELARVGVQAWKIDEKVRLIEVRKLKRTRR